MNKLELFLKHGIIVGNFIEYTVRRGKNGGRPKKLYGEVVEHNDKLFIKLYGYKNTYAKFYDGMYNIRILSYQEKEDYIKYRKKQRIDAKIRYIKYIIKRKDIKLLEKICLIKRYGLGIK